MRACCSRPGHWLGLMIRSGLLDLTQSVQAELNLASPSPKTEKNQKKKKLRPGWLFTW